jgi:hypothetical protein
MITTFSVALIPAHERVAGPPPQMEYEYRVIAGADHGSVIGEGMEAIFAFFEAHAQ